MKRSSTLVIIIPLTVVAIIIGLVFVMRISSKASEPVALPTEATIPLLKDDSGKPTNGFTVTTGRASSVSDLEMDVNMTADTNDNSEIDELQTEASAL